jgi:hypothetical protein
VIKSDGFIEGAFEFRVSYVAHNYKTIPFCSNSKPEFLTVSVNIYRVPLNVTQRISDTKEAFQWKQERSVSPLGLTTVALARPPGFQTLTSEHLPGCLGFPTPGV